MKQKKSNEDSWGFDDYNDQRKQVDMRDANDLKIKLSQFAAEFCLALIYNMLIYFAIIYIRKKYQILMFT